MIIEDGRLANVAHLANVSYCRLPRDAAHFRLLIVVHRDALPLLTDHVAELVVGSMKLYSPSLVVRLIG